MTAAQRAAPESFAQRVAELERLLKDATPGPWRLGSGNISNCIEGQSGKKLFDNDNGFRTVATYQSCESSGIASKERANAEANAALIASSPEAIRVLLEALRETRAALVEARSVIEGGLETEHEMEADWSKEDRATVKRIDAALAKFPLPTNEREG